MTAAHRRRGHLTLLVSPTVADDDTTAARGDSDRVIAAAGPELSPAELPGPPAVPAHPAPQLAPAAAPSDLPGDAAAIVRLVGGPPVAIPACDLIDFANSGWAGLVTIVG